MSTIYTGNELVIQINDDDNITAWLSDTMLDRPIESAIVTYYSSIILGLYNEYTHLYTTHDASEIENIKFSKMEHIIQSAIFNGLSLFGKNNNIVSYNIYKKRYSSDVIARQIINIIESGNIHAGPYLDVASIYHNYICELGRNMYGDNCCKYLHTYIFNLTPFLNNIIKFKNENLPYWHLMHKMLMSTIDSPYIDAVWSPRPPIIDITHVGTKHIPTVSDIQFDTDAIKRAINLIYNTVTSSTNDTATLLYDIFGNNETNQLAILGWLIISCACKHFDKFIIDPVDMDNEYFAKLTDNISIYKIKYCSDTDKQARFDHLDYFTNETGDTNYGFHGSMIGNWYSIFTNGIQIGGTGTQGMHFNGSAYGTGVYLSNRSDFSLGYSISNHDMNRDIIMGVFQVDPNISTYKKTDSIYVIPDTDKLCLKYIIICSGTTISGKNSDLINSYFANASKQIINTKTQQRSAAAIRRLTREFELYTKGITTYLAQSTSTTHGVRLDTSTNPNQPSPHNDDLDECYSSDDNGDSYEEDSDLDSDSDSPQSQPTDTPPQISSTPSPILLDAEPTPSPMLLDVDASAATPTPTPVAAAAATPISVEVKAEAAKSKKPWFEVSISSEAGSAGDITCWYAKVDRDKFLDPNEPLEHRKNTLYRQLTKNKIKSVDFEIEYPEGYPFSPPFVRVVYPRFKYQTGHITIGGSICNQLITKSGWSPALAFENVLLDIVTNITNCADDPTFIKTGQLDDSKWNVKYTKHEAIEAHTRMLRTYNDAWNSNTT